MYKAQVSLLTRELTILQGMLEDGFEIELEFNRMEACMEVLPREHFSTYESLWSS